MAGAFALNVIFQNVPRLARAVVEKFGGAAGIFSLDPDGIFEALGPYNKYSAAIASVSLEKKSEELRGILRRYGCSFLCWNDPAFPKLLNECEDGPIAFFVRCTDSMKNVFLRENISVVGTRDMSQYGQQWTRKIVTALSSSDRRPTVVSGLAFGIDISSQNAALEHGLPTIAVLGNGIDGIYPRQHEIYARRIIESAGGAVITEYQPGTSPLAMNFLCRNRIIAGLSRATVLVESKLKGGGMITARIASSYGREVFAVPGRCDDVRSQGCNLLLQRHIAEPLVSCDVFLKSLDYKRKQKVNKDIAAQLRHFYEGSMDGSRIRDALRIVELIKKEKGISLDGVVSATGLPCSTVSSLLNRMESDGFVSCDLLQSYVPGGKF